MNRGTCLYCAARGCEVAERWLWAGLRWVTDHLLLVVSAATPLRRIGELFALLEHLDPLRAAGVRLTGPAAPFSGEPALSLIGGAS